ncbi:MAG TPA: glycosyltransferase family 39 protein [Solirubrobacterales bacterium]
MLGTPRAALVAIVLAGLVLRIGAVATDGGYKPANDAFEYDYYARAIADGDGYPRSGYLLQGGPTAIRGPGYPYFLGGVYALSGSSATAGRVADALLGALAIVLTYLIARRIWGVRVGLLAAALTAVFPPLVLLSRELLSESLFIVLELGAVLCALNYRRSGGALGWAAGAGALCGLALLTRNTGLALLLPLALGVLVLQPRFRPRALLGPAVLLAVAALVVAPWTIRNTVQFDRFVPLTTSAGITAAGVYNPTSHDSNTHGAWRDPRTVPSLAPLFETPGLDEAEVDAKLRREARDFAWQHPVYVAEAFGWNLARMFELTGGSVVDREGNPVDDRGIGSAAPTSERIGIAILVLLGLVGTLALIFSRRANPGDSERPPGLPRGPFFLWLIPILILTTTALVNGLPRDRLPADPFLLILAAIGLAVVYDRARGREIQAR